MDLAFACLSVLAGAAFLCTGGFLAALAGTALITTVFAASTLPRWSRTARAHRSVPLSSPWR